MREREAQTKQTYVSSIWRITQKECKVVVKAISPPLPSAVKTEKHSPVGFIATADVGPGQDDPLRNR